MGLMVDYALSMEGAAWTAHAKFWEAHKREPILDDEEELAEVVGYASAAMDSCGWTNTSAGACVLVTYPPPLGSRAIDRAH
jgi:hypothetical protein